MRINEKPAKTRRIWVPQVAVDVQALRIRVDVAEARGLDPTERAVAAGVRGHLDKASDAAFRRDPLPRRVANWWGGTLVETAYRHMHAADAQVIDLFDDNELQAEIPLAVARAQAAMHREDIRQWTVEELKAAPPLQLRHHLRRITTDSFAALDAKLGQLRNFRNILLLASLLITALVIATLAVVARWPSVMPLCFPNEVAVSADPPVTQVDGLNCPTRSQTDEAERWRRARRRAARSPGWGTGGVHLDPEPEGHHVPVRRPRRAGPAQGPARAPSRRSCALVAIRAEFVPGLSSLDSQEQILAYALVFGFAQQLFTRLLDQRAQTLLDNLPSKDAADQPPRPPPAHPTVPEAPPPGLPRRRRRPTDRRDPARCGGSGAAPADGTMGNLFGDVTPGPRPVSPCRPTPTPGGDMTSSTRVPADRDHRHLRGPAEDDEPQDARPGAGGARGDVALPGRAQGHDEVRPQDRVVEPARPEPGVVRDHGRGRRDRLQLLPRPPLLHGAQPRARRGQGARGAAVAGVHGLHPAGAAGDGVRRGDVPDPADRHRRDVGRAARGAGGARAARADRQDRRHEHDRPGQRRARHPVGRSSRRPAACRRWRPGRRTASPRHDRRPVRRPPQPAVHRRLRDARLGRRRRGRGAGDLAAVGGRWTGRRCGTRGPTWSGSSPARRSTGCAPWPAGARTTSGSGCPSRC